MITSRDHVPRHDAVTLLVRRRPARVGQARVLEPERADAA